MPWLGRSLASAPAALGLVSLGSLSLLLAACGPISQAAPSQTYFPVIHAPSAGDTPTPGPLTYTVGAWPSNSAPAPYGQVTIYVSFRNEGVPVAGAAASVTVQYPGHWRSFGSVKTDHSGFAAIVVPVGGVLAVNHGSGEQSVLVNVQVNYQGQSYQATTNFTPLP